MRGYLSGLLLSISLIGIVDSARAETLVLANGDKLTGEVLEWAVDHVVIEHPQLGTMKLSLDQLELDTGTPPNPGLFGTRLLRGWTRRVDVGINGEQGTSKSANVTVGSRLGYDDPWTQWRFNGRYFYNLSDDDGDDDNNATVDLTKHWLFPESRWFTMLGGRYQFDEFQTWKHRVTILAGPGLHLFQDERHSLDLVVGPSYTREFGASKTNKAEVAVALTYEWQVSERQSVDFANQYFQQLSPDAGAFRNFTTLNWSLRITESPALSLNVGLQNEYESNPDPGDKNNDLKYA